MNGIRLWVSAFIFILSFTAHASDMSNPLPAEVSVKEARPSDDFFTEGEGLKFLKPSSYLFVRYKGNSDTAIKVKIVGKKEDDKLSCEFRLDDPMFKEKAKWNPLPV